MTPRARPSRRPGTTSAVQDSDPQHEGPEDEEQFTLYAGPLSRASLRNEVLRFCNRHDLTCEVSQRRDRLFSTAMTFHVRGSTEAIAAVAGYLQWTTRSYRTNTTGDVGPF